MVHTERAQLQQDGAPAGKALSASDLAELIGAFNDVTGRLQATHESLRAEVSRLQGELAQANKQLERSQRLATLGEMAAGIAHEVRNPLGSIRLHARLLEQDLGERPPQRDLTRKILGAVEGLDAVVSDVLSFSKEFRVRPVATDASELLERAIEECLPAERELRARTEAGLAALVVRRGDLEGAPIELECDPTLVHRALVNLVRNAIQAMTPEAHERSRRPALRELQVTARAERVATPDGAACPMAVLTIRDTGPGISRDVLERMFNPFFTTRAAGTGLGLSIVHRIIDAHHGMVRVRNRAAGEGTGAVVEVFLPVRAAPGNEQTESTRGQDGALSVGGAGERAVHTPSANSFAGLTEHA